MSVSKSEFISDIQRVANCVGSPPTTAGYTRLGEWTCGVGYRLFDSWDEVLKTAGLDPHKKNRWSPSDKQDTSVESDDEWNRTLVREEIILRTEELGRKPLLEDLIEVGLSQNQIYKSYDSLYEARYAAYKMDKEMNKER